MSGRSLALAIALAACGRGSDSSTRGKGVFRELEIKSPPGMSGLAADDHDVLWAVPERDRQLVEMTLDGKITLHPMSGFPDGVDTEGLAWLGPNRFAVTTEGQDDATATIIFAELRAGTLVATTTRPLTSEELGVTLIPNHGAEASCGRGDDVIVGIEAVGKRAGGRWAPIARLRGNTLTVAKLALTTDTGKISGLDCTIDPDGTAHAWAIERHYGVSRILHFDLPLGATEIQPRIALDLAPMLRDSLNLEGIVQLSDGRLVVINDNQGRSIDGPSELLIFEPGAVH